MDERFAAQQAAVQAAERSNVRAFDKVNEFRQAMSDAADRYADKATVNVRFDAFGDRIAMLEKSRYTLEGKAVEAAKANRTALSWLGLGLVILQIVVAVLLWVLGRG